MGIEGGSVPPVERRPGPGPRLDQACRLRASLGCVDELAGGGEGRGRAWRGLVRGWPGGEPHSARSVAIAGARTGARGGVDQRPWASTGQPEPSPSPAISARLPGNVSAAALSCPAGANVSGERSPHPCMHFSCLGSVSGSVCGCFSASGRDEKIFLSARLIELNNRDGRRCDDNSKSTIEG